MAKKKTKRRRSVQRFQQIFKKCPFCEEKKQPDYKDYQNLRKFLTDRAKIIGKRRSGVCSKHQRKITVAIKRARHLGLLPFAQKI